MSAQPPQSPYNQPSIPPYAPPAPAYGYPPAAYVVQAAPASGAATASLIFGILSYFLLPLIGSIVAIICGHVALGQIRSSQGRIGGNGMAITGLVLGYLQFAGWVLFFAILIIIGVAASSS
jgi:hypothetical protein